MISKQRYRAARDRSMEQARRAMDIAALCDREGASDRANFSREQAALYVKDARYFNRRAIA